VWNTNDDIGMSMALHGYGIASQSSPNLIYSNVLWGKFLQIIPDINGIISYSLVTIAIMILTGSIIFNNILRFNKSSIFGILVFLLIMIRPLLFPQFTINSGLLFTASITAFLIYLKEEKKSDIIIFTLLLFCSFLVRKEEFILLLLLLIPVLEFSKLFNDKNIVISTVILFIFLIVATLIDHLAYSDISWDKFRSIRAATMPIIDFRISELLLSNKEILDKHSYSPNDINLIGNFFLIDPHIVDPKRLSNLVADVSFLHSPKYYLNQISLGISTLFTYEILPLFLISLLFLINNKDKRLVVIFILILFVIIILSILGRPSNIRVVYPLFVFFIVTSTLLTEIKFKAYHLFIFYIVVIINTVIVLYQSKIAETENAAIKKSFQEEVFPILGAWGAAYPYEKIFPVLQKRSEINHSQKLYQLAVFTHAPFSNAYEYNVNNMGMIDGVINDAEGFKVATSDYLANLFKIYCLEHHNLLFKESNKIQLNSNYLYSNYSCKKNNDVIKAINYLNGYKKNKLLFIQEPYFDIFNKNLLQSTNFKIKTGKDFNSTLKTQFYDSENEEFKGFFILVESDLIDSLDIFNLYNFKILNNLKFGSLSLISVDYKYLKSFPIWFNNELSIIPNSLSLHNIGKFSNKNNKPILVSSREELGALHYGPYIDIEKGSYSITFFIESSYNPKGVAKIDIAANAGKRIIYESLLFNGNGNHTFTFEITDPERLEFRVWSLGTESLEFSGVRLRKLSSK
jgi:hypothetical protein